MSFINVNNITYELIKTNSQAKIIHSQGAFGDVFIPHSIFYNNREYLVTIISEGSFKNNQKIKSVYFPEDSELNIIDKEAFLNSSLTNISIPAKVSQIGESAFSKCKKLENVIFSPNSQLYMIGKNVFSYSSIKKIFFPSKLRKIEEESFINCNHLNSIIFSSDSELEIIGKNAFCYSSISSLVIPPKLRRLEERWCHYTHDFNHIEILKGNKNFFYFDDKFLLGKTDEKTENFDILLFARRDMKEAVIPSFVQKIGSFAFSGCMSLFSIDFQENSQLTSIDKFSLDGCSSLKKIFVPESVEEISEGWCNSKITHFSISSENKNFLYYDKKILIGKLNKTDENFNVILFARRNVDNVFIPSFVKQIGELSFFECNDLKSVEFESISNIFSINKNAFSRSSLERIIIPKNVNFIDYKAFFMCDKLKILEFEQNSQLISINDEAFYLSSIEQIRIPSSCKHIGRRSFSSESIKLIEFTDDSELNSIDEEAFSSSSIIKINIPLNVTIIKERTFKSCNKLQMVKFAPNSKLKMIENEAFCYSAVNQICFPSKLEELKNEWCKGLSCLQTIKISNENESFKFLESNILIGKSERNLKDFDDLIFANRDIKSIFIPSNIKQIKPNAFYMCKNLQIIEFAPDSKLKSIGKKSFAYSSINKIIIPDEVHQIDDEAFLCCKLKTIKFSSKSKLSLLGEKAFSLSHIESIIIPKNVKVIESETFNSKKLLAIELLSDILEIKKLNFNSNNIWLVSIPNARKLMISKKSFTKVSKEFTFYINSYAIISNIID